VTTIVCDTNIVVGLLSRTDALHLAAVRAASEWEIRAANVAISAVTWAELRTGAVRQGRTAESALIAFRTAIVDAIVPVDEYVAEIAARYRAADLSLRMPDALILATGEHIGAAAVLTADKRLARAAPGLIQLVVPEL
jgi:predicted nucleic acid-binding protein